MNRLLKIKHWQLFLLLIGVPIILEVVGIAGTVISRHIPLMLFFFVPTMLLYILIYGGWYYALGTNLHKKLPPTVTMNLKQFKIFLFIPYAYIFLICILISLGVFGVFQNIGHSAPSPMVILPIVLAVIPIHIFSIFCLFYCLYFIAKSLKAVELQKPVTFNDYAGEFFLMWFYPIGIWFIQPRVNKIFDDTLQTTEQI